MQKIDFFLPQIYPGQPVSDPFLSIFGRFAPPEARAVLPWGEGGSEVGKMLPAGNVAGRSPG